ncbi:MAG: enoyl-CoA hydratase/isomerase family protein [Nevskia sp.]|nr:enoyl-CoA hydratase/isomerase family protein [Nevskia sp.]
MNTHRISLKIENQVAWLTLDNPAGRNAVDDLFVEAFANAADACAADPAVKVIVLGARGELFSVGGDLAGFLANEHRIRAHVHRMATIFHLGIQRLHEAPAPVVAALNGTAAGGGFSIVCGADLVVARRSAKLVSAYTKSGLTPDGGLSWLLERAVGYRKAFEIMALNPVLSAEAAQQLGLVTEVVDDDKLDEAVQALVARLLQTPADALRNLKRLMRGAGAVPLSEQLRREADGIAAQAANPETMEALRRFFTKSR